MSTAPLFQRFVQDELALAPALVARVLAGTMQLLGQSKDGPLSASDRANHSEIVKALQRDAPLYEKTFVESLSKRVHEEVDESPDASFAEEKASSGGLELMDESRVEIDIEISRAMQLIDSTAEWELRELQTFTSTLTGQSHVNADSNPFRPLLYASALWDAACSVISSPTQRGIVLRTSAGVVAGLLKNAWAAASTRLETQGVEPGAYRTIVLPSGASFGRFAAPESARTGVMSALLSSMPGTSSDASSGKKPQGDIASGDPRGVRSDGTVQRSPELEQALLRLDELLRRVPAETSLTGARAPSDSRIEQYRAALVSSANEPVDRQVIELVTRLFESLLSDSQLPGAFRPVLARMQIACLRVALAEHSMLDSYEHPVWRLLDRIGEISLGYSRLEDPRLSAFLSFSAAVAEEMAGSTSPDTTLFRRGLNRVDVFLSEQLQNQLRLAQVSVDALQLAERREILQQHLAQRLTDQMVSVRASPTIRRFITGTWAQVIAEDMLRHGEQSEPTMSDLKTVDDLLWSLKIPDHPQSRQRLLQLLPGLLQRLRTGMELVALGVTEQQSVMNELMVIHTEALRPGTRGSGALTPEEIVQKMRDEVLPESAAARSFSDSVIDLSSMETVPAEHLPSSGDKVDDDPARRIEAMRAGDRQRIFLQGHWSRTQLLWRSDRSLFFLFAGDSPARTHSITRRALERLSSAALVQAIESKPLVQRAVDRMMRELSPRA
ncbi:MAG: DUF1631 domain-containing protein [Pseudomonadota bacterium]|nr:DUF1631 domain-containing protein [Pseudomonadota bacterium]